MRLVALGVTAALVAAASTGCERGSSPIVVRIVHRERNAGVYSPSVVRIEAGGEVTWVETDRLLVHTATATAGSFGSSFLSYGQRYTVRFNAPGVYAFFCRIHPTMRGRVVVR